MKDLINKVVPPIVRDFFSNPLKRNALLLGIFFLCFLILLFIPCKTFLQIILMCISLVLTVIFGINFVFHRGIQSKLAEEKDDLKYSKKYLFADVDHFRKLFMRVGLIVSLLVILLSFDWEACEIGNSSLAGELAIPEELEVDIPPSKQERPPPPPPPPPQIEIKQDEEIIEDEPEIEDIEVDEETEIEIIPEEETGEAEIFMVVEEMPEFPGGVQALYKYIGNNIKYPNIARENGVEGKVYINFVVEPSGQVSNVKVLRGIGAGCDEEAIRVVKSLPAWKPGKQRGKPVRVSYNLPISFKIN